MPSVVPLLLFLTGLALSAQLAGTLIPPLALLSGMSLLALGLMWGPWGPVTRKRPLLLIPAALALTCAVLLLFAWPHGRVNRLFALCILLVGADVAFRAFARSRPACYPAALTSLFASVFFLTLDYSPPFWLLWRKLAFALSHVAGIVVGRPLKLAPAAGGLNVFAFFAIALLVLFTLRRRRDRARLVMAFVTLAALLLMHAFVMTLLPNFEDINAARAFAPQLPSCLLVVLVRHVPWDVPLLLVPVSLVAVWIVVAGADLRPVRFAPTSVRGFRRAGAFALTLVAAVAVLVMRAPERPVVRDGELRKRVVLCSEGYLNWDVPTFERFDQHGAGMFGRLPVFLQQLGFDATLAERLDNAALAEAHIAVIINPDNEAAYDREAVWDFVRAGGNLLVVGEHTWRNEAKQDTLNRLLSPSAIRVNFDSATWQIGGWLHGTAGAPGGPYHHMRDHLNQPGFGIGASLEVGYGAEPLLVGVNGFSDAGVLTEKAKQESFYGDNRYRPGEQLGEVVLAVRQDFGKGRVVVLADTTSLVNHLMVGSHEAASNVMGCLASRPVARWHLARLIAAVILVTAACVRFALTPWRYLLPVLVVAVVAAAGTLVCAAWTAAPIRLLPEGDVAYIDGSHVERYSRDAWRPDGLTRLHLNLMRNDMQPMRMDTFSEERLMRARIFFIIAPTRRYSEREMDAIERFIDQGGYVVVSAGAESAGADSPDPDALGAVGPLLKRFDLKIRNRPLGPFTAPVARAKEDVRLRVAYTVDDTRGSPDDVLASTWFDPRNRHAVIVERVRAKGDGPRGGLLLICDGQFFLNKNFEAGEGDTAPGHLDVNVRFLRWLVQRVRALRQTEPPQ